MPRWSHRAWVAGIERRQRAVLAGSLVIAVLCAGSLTQLRLDIDVLGMLPRGRLAFDDFRAFVGEFGELNELVVLIEGAPAERLRAFADAFADRLTRLDSVARVQARIDLAPILNGVLGRYLYNYIPEAAYDEIAQRLTPAGIADQVRADRVMLNAPFDLSTTRAVVADPLGLRLLAAAPLAASVGRERAAMVDGYLTSTDGGAVVVLVRPTAGAFDIAFTERLMRDVQDAQAAARAASAAPPALRVAYTGSYVFALEDAAMMQRDIARYTVLALLAVLAVFAVAYRNLRILPFVTYPLLLTTLVTCALSLALYDELNAVSISFAAILYGLSIDSGIYFYTRLLQERQRPEHHDAAAVVTATLAGLGRANLAATATTAAAFFVIGLSSLTAVRQLGALTGLGMLVTAAEFFTLYPALGFVALRHQRGALTHLDTPRLGAVGGAVSARAPVVTVVALAIGLVLLLHARHLGLDVSLTHLRPHDSAAARVQDEIAARFGVEASGGAVLIRRANTDEALAAAEVVATRLRGYDAEGFVQAVRSVGAWLPSPATQRARLDRFNQLPRAAAIDELQAALARAGFVPDRFADFFEAFAGPRHAIVRLGDPVLTPLAFLIERHVREHAGATTVAIYLQPAAGVSWRVIRERLLHDLPALDWSIAARGWLEEELEAVLRQELRWFWMLGLTGNVVLLSFTFRRVGVALAILVPVVLAIVALFAAMVFVGIALDPVNLIVTPLIFGIGVDYGVYITSRAREQGDVARGLQSAGRAVVTTALTTIAGFGLLGLSRYPPLASMGALAGVGLSFCVLFSIILLPACLAVADRRRTG